MSWPIEILPWANRLSEGPVQTKKRARIADDQKAENSTEDVEEEEAEEEAASLGEEAEVSDGEGKQGHAEASHGMNEPTKTRQKPKRRKRRRRRKGAISNGESSEVILFFDAIVAWHLWYRVCQLAMSKRQVADNPYDLLIRDHGSVPQ